MLAAASPISKTSSGRRRRYRQRIANLVYVNLDLSNGAIIRDLSPAGIAVQAVAPLKTGQPVHVSFDLARPRLHVETTGMVAWADARGQAGLEFPQAPERVRRGIKQWILIQFLERAERLQGPNQQFGAESSSDLLFSEAPRTPIRLQAAVRERPAAVGSGLKATCWPVRTIDALLIVAATLLFALLAAAVMRQIPGWRPAALTLLGAGATFAAIYWVLFVGWIGVLPGNFLVGRFRKAQQEERARFR